MGRFGQVTMSGLSRREFLWRLSVAYGAALMGCHRKDDWFARELVCIHVLHPRESVPAPLLEKPATPAIRRDGREYFNIGLPELVLCTTRMRLLDMFQYFWPFSRDDFEQLQRSIEIQYQKPAINGPSDVEEFATRLRGQNDARAQLGANVAVIFTFNEFTRYWTADVIAACQQARVEEFVLFKDPSRPPYLCDYPARQKGFKRPPP